MISSQNRDRATRRFALPLPVIALLAAAFFRLFQLNTQGLWYDEIFSVYFARADIPNLLRGLALEGTNPPLYYLLLHPLVQADQVEWVLRSFSVGFGLLALPLTYIVARRLIGSQGALWAIWLAALNPFQVYFSREGRTYSLLVCAALLTIYAFLRLLERNERRWWVLLLAGHVLLSMTHIFGLLIILVEFLVLAVQLRRTHHLLWTWLFVTAVSMVPLGAWTVFAYFERGHQLALLSPAFPIASPLDLVYTFWNFSLAYAPPLTALNAVGLAAFAGLAVFGWLKIRRMNHSKATFLLLWLAPIPLVLLIGLRRELYGDRYLITTTPALLIVFAAGLAAIRGATWRRLAGFAISLLLILNLVRIYSDPIYAKEQWRQAAQIITQGAQPGDVILTTGITNVISLGFYYQGEVPIYPLMTDRPDLSKARRAWVVVGYLRRSAHMLAQPDILDADFNPDQPISPNRIDAPKRLRQVWPMSGVTLALYDLNSP